MMRDRVFKRLFDSTLRQNEGNRKTRAIEMKVRVYRSIYADWLRTAIPPLSTAKLGRVSRVIRAQPFTARAVIASAQA